MMLPAQAVRSEGLAPGAGTFAARGVGRPRPQGLAVVVDVAILVTGYVSLMLPGNREEAAVRLAIWSCVLVLVWLAFALHQGAYRQSVLAHPLRSPYVIAKTTILAGAVFHLLPLVGGPVNSRVASIAVVAALVVSLVAWRLVLSRLASAVAPVRDLVVVGAGWAGQNLASALAANPSACMRLVAFIDAEGRLGSPGVQMYGVPVYPASELTAVVERVAGPVRVVLAATDQSHAAIYDQLTSLTQAGIEVAAMTSVYEEVTGCIPVHHLGNSWWAVLPRPSTDLGYRAAKQVLDCAGGLAGLLVLAVLVPVIGPLLMRETGGSLFFTQIRVGRLGKPFRVIKLRTLAVTGQAQDSLWERKTANRPSRLGALIRATGIDELPQCLNVLKGEMSLVGPRPYVAEEVADFQRSIPFFKTRALVRPGITGWAQINLGYGFSLDDEIGKLQYDLYYVGRQSFYLDLLIIARTACLLFRRRRRMQSKPSAARGQERLVTSDLDIERRARPAVMYRYDGVLAVAEASQKGEKGEKGEKGGNGEKGEQADFSSLVALADLGTLRLPIVVLAHQPSLGPGLAPVEVVDDIVRRLRELADPGADFELEVCFCGHPAEGSECLGAGPNLLRHVASELGLDLARSVFLSDRSVDLLAASALGALAVLVGPQRDAPPLAPSAGIPQAATVAEAVELLQDEMAPVVRPVTAAVLGVVHALDAWPPFRKLRASQPGLRRGSQDGLSEFETVAQDGRSEFETVVQDGRSEYETVARDGRSQHETVAPGAAFSGRRRRQRRHHHRAWLRRLPDRRRVLSGLVVVVSLVLVVLLVSSCIGALLVPAAAG